MITEIGERTVVQRGGKIEISSSELTEGTEVVVLVEKEMDTTEYLLSTEANRRHLMQALDDLKDPKKRIYIDLDDPAGSLRRHRQA